MGTYIAKCDICGTENTVASYGDWHCRQCGQGYTYDECHQIRLTDAQLALLRSPPRWIPVSERLPEEDEPVLACWVPRKDGMSCAMIRNLNGKVCWTPADQWTECDPPTHWMPLPQPPSP